MAESLLISQTLPCPCILCCLQRKLASIHQNVRSTGYSQGSICCSTSCAPALPGHGWLTEGQQRQDWKPEVKYETWCSEHLCISGSPRQVRRSTFDVCWESPQSYFRRTGLAAANSKGNCLLVIQPLATTRIPRKSMGRNWSCSWEQMMTQRSLWQRR